MGEHCTADSVTSQSSARLSTTMGGDSFPDTERLSEQDYIETCGLVSRCLAAQNLQYQVPVEVKDKAEICLLRGKEKPYGDVDIIVGLHPKDNVNRLDVVSRVIEAVGGDSGDIHKNDSTYSFLTEKRHQVDIKFCDIENLSFLAAFKSNNDFGALLGHLLTPLSLKWSEKGMMLKLKLESVSGVGAVKGDLLLTKDLTQVCHFLSLPTHSLDGETRLSCLEIFQILTNCRAFFPQDYDERYKIRERRKRRPVSDTFFNYLENSDIQKLEEDKNKKFEEDPVENLLRKYRSGKIEYFDYIDQVAVIFGLQDDLHTKLENLRTKIQDSSAHPKFNYKTLVDWYPELSPNTTGKLFGKIKSSHSGNGKESFIDWIESTPLEDIRKQAEILRFDKYVK